MRIRGMEYFLAVVEHGSFSDAAGVLGVTQSAVSQAITALESELGATLFIRNRHGARLTAAGHELVEPARRVVGSIAAVRRRVRTASQGDRGVLRVACPRRVASDALPPALGTVRRAHPSIEILVSEPTTTPNEDLVAGEIDVFLTFDPPPPGTRYRVRRFAPVELVAALPTGVAPSAAPLPVDELLALGLVLGPPGDAYRTALQEVRDPVRIDRSVVVESEHPESIMLMVAAGAGATVMPERLARVGADRLGLVIRAMRPRLRQSLFVVHSEDPANDVVWTLVDNLGATLGWSDRQPGGAA